MDYEQLQAFYEMGKDFERHILLGILKYALGFDDFERLLSIREGMNSPSQ